MSEQRYLVIDCETSGKIDFSQPADAKGQPRLAELVMLGLDPDLSIAFENQYYVKPDGWTLDPEAAAVNGLTLEILEARGVPIATVLDAYTHQITVEECAVVSWNAQFDCKMLRRELRLANRDDLFELTKNICAMRAATRACGLLQKDGRRAKFPKLTEACEILLGRPAQAPHSALGDAHDCLDIFRWLHGRGELPEAAVHYAKTYPLPEATA